MSDLVPEVTHASQHHHNAALVRGGDHLIIAHAAARLDDAGRTRINHNIQAIAKRKEGIRCNGRTFEGQARVVSLD